MIKALTIEKYRSARPCAPASAANRNNKGAALIALLWALVAVSLIGLTVADEIRVETYATRNEKVMLQGYYLARGAIAAAAHKLLLLQLRPGGPINPDQVYQPRDVELGRFYLDFADGRALCELEDESGKLNVNFINPNTEAVLRNLMIEIGLDKREGDIIVDSILDWVDPDNLHRANGAEEEYYRTLPNPYRPRNGPIEALEELLLVRGITPDIFYGKKVLGADGQVRELYGLSRHLTVYSVFPQINVNSAPLALLRAIPGIDENTALSIYEQRKVRPFRQQQDIPALPEVVSKYLNVNRSNIYSIKATGEPAGSPVRRVIRAVIAIDLNEKNRHKILHWNENSVF